MELVLTQCVVRFSGSLLFDFRPEKIENHFKNLKKKSKHEKTGRCTDLSWDRSVQLGAFFQKFFIRNL